MPGGWLWATLAIAAAGRGAATVPEGPAYGARLLTADEAPLTTQGRYIIDVNGERIKWACVNWYGAYSTTHAVGGLEIRPLDQIVDRIVELGFNCVRMMYSTQGYALNPEVKDEDVAANPDLKGKRFLEIFDRTIQAMTDKGLMVIVNNHNSKSGWCCHYSQDEGLWYVPEYTEEVWIESLVFFAARYRDNKMVVAMDLRNEVHDYKDTHLTWGGGDPKTDWAAAAVRAGNAVLTVSPDLIIVVMAMCFGMDLRGMKNMPVQMMYPNRVVYQTHNYLEYQLFDNISKMVAPWHVIREWCTAAFLCLLCVVLFGLYGWLRLGKPRPPPGLLATSFGLWYLLYFLGACAIAWSMYNFGMQFCAISMEMDVKPWIVGSALLALASCLVALNGARIMLRARKARVEDPVADDPVADPGPEEKPGKASEGAGGTPEPLGAAVEDEVPEERETIGEDVEDEAAAAAETEPAGGGRGGGRRGRPCCRGRGCASLRRVGETFARDVDWLGRHVFHWLGLPVAVPQKRDVKLWSGPAEWDLGLSVALQLVVVSLIFATTVFVVYLFAHFIPTYWWMERHLDGLWGFALEDNYTYTAPVWMGEFGAAVRGQWWLNFVRYLATRDVDFAYWAINGRKWAEGEIDTSSGDFLQYPDGPRWEDEAFGLLNNDYKTVRHAWKLLDMQALLASPATYRPEVFPCSRTMDPSCGT